MINKYLDSLAHTIRAGDTTEASFYADLKQLLTDFLTSKGFDPSITIQPKISAVGIPDFTIRKGKDLIGYIEAKDPKYDNLDNLPDRDTGQIKRYREKLPNLIVTNFLDFRLYREGKLTAETKIGFSNVLLKLNQSPPVQNEDKLTELLNLFFAFLIPETKTPKSLAVELAHRAQLLPIPIVHELENNVETKIDQIYRAFEEYLMKGLSFEKFADIYAQTITYGLFMARLRYPDKTGFDRTVAEKYLPKSVTLLRETFKMIADEAIPEALASYVDDIATILGHADFEKINKELRDYTGESDPLIRFYETFLAEYDPAKRKSMGVYYTPQPVISYIVSSVHQILKAKFHLKEGLANEEVTLLDPAAGTLTFPAEAIKTAVAEHRKWQDSPASLKKHLLNHFFAFEYEMAPYVIGHLRANLLFEELRIPLSDNDRFPLYLTNSLDFTEIDQTGLPFVTGLAQEAKDAMTVKKKDVLVILGNPPYSGQSTNKSDFILREMEEYKKVNGKPLDEKNPKWLMDDYVKFIRFAQWKIDSAGQGIVAMITNHAWLDNPTFRGMRSSLLTTFDEITILNLHGSLLKKEKTPAGTKDENVFDIRPGVAIMIMVKYDKS